MELPSTRRGAAVLLIAGWLIGYGALFGLQVWAGRSAGPAAGQATLPVAFSVAATRRLSRSWFSGWFPARREPDALAALWAAAAGSAAGILLSAMGLPGPLPAAAAVGTAVILWFAYRRMLVADRSSRVRILQGSSSAADAADQVAAARHELTQTMAADRRAVVRFNLARSLTDLGAMTQDVGAMRQGAQILDTLAGEPTFDLGMQAVVAQELTGTKSSLAAMTGETTGWQETLDLQAAIAQRLADRPDLGPSARMRVLVDRADFYSFLMSRSGPGPDGRVDLNWDLMLDRAIEALEQAIAVTDALPGRHEMRGELELKLGSFLIYRDPDAGLLRLRAAQRHVRHESWHRHEHVLLGLALGLMQRARVVLEDAHTPAQRRQADEDLDEAEKLLRKVARRGRVMNGLAAEQMGELTRLRAEMSSV